MKDEQGGFPVPTSTPPQATEAPASTVEGARPTGGQPKATGGTPKGGVSSQAAVGIGIGGCVLGFLLGLMVTGTATEVERKQGSVSAVTPLPASAPPAVESARVHAAPGNTEVALDLGTKEANGALHGTWTDHDLGQRTVARTSGTAGLAVAITPSGDSYGIAIVGRSDGGGDVPLDVELKVNDEALGRWAVGPEWGIYAVTIEPQKLKKGSNSFDFSFQPPAGHPGQGLVVDTFHLAVLRLDAQADLGPPSPVGAFVMGYYGREGDGPSAATWSAGRQTRVGVLLKPLNTDYDIELHGAAYAPLQPLEVRAVVNGKAVGAAKVTGGPTTMFRVPAGTFTVGVNTIDFAYARTIKPSQVDPKSKDQRELSMRMSKVSVKPASTR